MSPESIWEDILSVGVYSLAVGSTFRAMEEKNSVHAAMSYPSGNPELGFSPLCFQSPTPAPFAPCAKDVHGAVPTSAWPDLCLCGYREQIKWIVCMCSIFIANTNEKWAHPLPFGYSPFACFLRLDTTKFLFLNLSIWKELDSPLNHKKGKSGAPEGHADIVNEVHSGCPFDTVHKVLHIKLWQHAVCVN